MAGEGEASSWPPIWRTIGPTAVASCLSLAAVTDRSTRLEFTHALGQPVEFGLELTAPSHLDATVPPDFRNLAFVGVEPRLQCGQRQVIP
jgi:hypothetical protein